MVTTINNKNWLCTCFIFHRVFYVKSVYVFNCENMNIKVKCLILFLLYLSQKINTLCSPCSCNYQNIIFPGEPDWKTDHGWLWKRKSGRGINLYTIWCVNHAGMHNLPSDTPTTIEHLYTAGTSLGRRNGITKQLFQRFTQIEYLRLGNVEARSVDKDLLEPHRNTLTELTICSNGGITDLTVGTFQKAPLLWGITLHTNNIRKIHKGLFSNLQHLIWIDLERNRINVIEAGAFHNTPALTWIYFKYNMLTYLDINIIDDYKIYRHYHTVFENNRWFCNPDLCPFMHHGKPTIPCSDPIVLQGKPFSEAIKYVGTKAHKVRHIVDIGKSVEMACSTCSFTKLAWKKVGTGTLPPDGSITQAEASRTSTLKFSKVNEQHDGNYSCYNPECTAADCPEPIISLTVLILEPNWNFTGREGEIDEVIRHGYVGFGFGLLPLAIYSIIMAMCMSGYWAHKKMKKRREQQSQPARQP